ncbi:MAG: BspA family leucine-rich repeat surface protein [Butyrivibrio sp.]|nr:BspA family leucine-rich repeat surface protein [Butyrivibrio sp.]
MKNRIFRSNNKKGYTLAEALIAIAIIAILGAVAAISANRMIKDSRQKSLDKMAETIFLVAERNIQKAYWVDGVSLGASGTVTDSSAVDIKNKVLPDDAVSADISSAKWFITYESKDDNCHVDFVYCTTSDNSYASTFAYDEGTLSSAWSSKEGKVGYYNGGDMDELPYTAGISSDKMYAALKVENKEELGVGVYIQLPDYEKNPDYYGSSSLNPKNVKYKLSITGLNSGAVYTFDEKELNPSSSKFTYQRRTKNCFISTDSESGGKCAIYRDYVVLDNLSDSAKQFKSVAKASESGLIPGEDILIEISATCVGSEAELSANANLAGGEAGNEAVFFEDDSNGWGKSAQTNSLFAKREVVDADSDQVEVAYGRHLQNLDTLVSGMPEDKKLKVVQTKTIDFKITDTTVPINENWIDLYGSDWTFTPIDNKKVDSYDGGAVINPSDGSVGADGQTQGVRNLIVNYTTRRARATDTAYETAKEKDRIISAGIFGKFYGSEIKNVLCHGFLIDYRRAEKLVEESTAVGCLVGRARTNLKLRNCRAENAELTAAQSFTTSQDKVMMGGLVGHALDGVDVQYCFADRNIIIGYENCCYASGLIGFTSSANYTPDSPQMDNTEAVMKDCKVSRSIVGGVRSGGIITGGMIAYTYNKNLIFENCIVEGVKFSASSGNGVAVVGGIVGSPIATTGLIKNCKVYNTADDEAAYVESAIGNNGVYDKSNIAKARKFVNSTAVAGTTNYDARNNSWMYTVGGSSTSEDGKVDIVSMGGLAGLNIVSSGNALVIENSFASTTMYAQNNRGINGGLIGNGRSKAKAIIRNSYADCYLNGQFISGLASNCKDSEYYNSYSTGLLRCDGAIKAAGITTSKATVSGCYSLMNYDNIWDTNKFNTTNLTFSDGYVTSYPGEAKPVNNNASLKNYIYLIAGDNSTVDENTYYTYGGDGDWIKDQSAQTSNKSQYASLRELVDKLGEQTDIIPSRLAPACISDNLASTKLPLILATSGTFTDTHYGDWLERPGNRLYARVYKTSDNKYVMFFEKGGRKSTLPTNSAITLTMVGEWLADDGKDVITADSGFLKQTDDGTAASAKLIAPWQYDGTGNVTGWTASTVKSIVSVTFDEAFCLDKKVTPAVSKAKPKSMRRWFKGFEATTVFNNIEKLDVSDVTNMAELFRNCYEVLKYDLSTWNTANVTSMQYMFGMGKTDIPIPTTANDTENSINRLAKTTEIKFGPKFVTANVTDMGAMFKRQGNLTTIDLSTFNFSNVTDMEFMFDFCKKMTSIVGFTNVDAGKVTNMNHLFYNDLAMPEYDLSGWTTSKTELKITRSMFGTYISDGNAHATRIVIGENFYTDGVEDMGYMFQSQDTIKELDLSTFNTGSVTHIKLMFFDCKKLETIYASEDFVVPSSADSAGMFDNCNVLVGGCGTKWADKSGTAKTDKTYAWIDGREDNPNTGTDEGYFTNHDYTGLYARVYKKASNASYYVMRFEKGARYSGDDLVFVAEWLGDDGRGSGFLNKTMDGAIRESNNHVLNEFAQAPWQVNGSYEGWYVLDDNAHARGESSSGDGISKVREVIFTDAFTSRAKPKDTSYWFWCFCQVQTMKDLDNLDTSAVTDMSHMFEWNYEVKFDNKTVNIDTSNVTNMTSMFRAHRNAIKEIIFGDKFVTDKVTNMANMFQQGYNLTELDLSKWNTSNVTNMSNMFDGCNRLKTIYASEDFDVTSVTNSSGMFNSCYVLVGGCGTKWSDKSGSGKTNKTYAWIDGRVGNTVTGTNEGYFTNEDYGTLYARVYKDANGDYVMYFEVGTVENHYGEAGDQFVTGQEWRADGDDGFFAPSKTGTTVDAVENCPWRVSNPTYYTSITKAVFTKSFCGLAKPYGLRNFFCRCTSLTEIVGLSDLDVSHVKGLAGFLQDCSAIETVDISGWDLRSVTDARMTFVNCSKLKTIYATEDVVFPSGANTDSLFGGCSSLKGGSGTAYTSSVTNRTYARIDKRSDGDNSLKGYFTLKTPAVYERVYDVSGQKVLRFEKYPQGDDVFSEGTLLQGTLLSTSEDGTFDGSVTWNNRLSTITSAEINTPIKPAKTTSWFKNATNLASISSMENLDTASATDMSSMFEGCTSLTALETDKIDVSAVTTFNSMFKGCTGLTNLDLSEWNVSSATNMQEMFRGCNALTTVTVSEFDVTGVASSTSMFLDCTSIQGGAATPTTYNPTYVDKSYARIDKGTVAPGYFTAAGTDSEEDVTGYETFIQKITFTNGRVVYYYNGTFYSSLEEAIAAYAADHPSP